MQLISQGAVESGIRREGFRKNQKWLGDFSQHPRAAEQRAVDEPSTQDQSGKANCSMARKYTQEAR
jgi:hypothetical protein